MALVNRRQAFMHLAQPDSGDRHAGHRPGAAHFVDTEEDPCVDQALVDPLDDRDRRCWWDPASAGSASADAIC